MTDDTQPEALRLAEILEGDYCPDWFYEQGVDEVAAELRRQHTRIAELESELEAVGAGGVQALSAAPAGFVPVAAFDRLHAHAESLAARLLAAEQAAPQPAPAPLSDDTALLDGLARLNWYVGPGDFYCDEAGGMNDYDDKNSGPEELRQAIRAALAAQGGKV